MPFFYRIGNERLRILVMASESILSQPEEEAQKMIDQIAMLPEDAQQQMITMLEDEQKQIQQARNARQMSPEEELQKIEEDKLKLTAISHEFDKAVLEVKEKTDQDETDGEAEALLNNL